MSNILDMIRCKNWYSYAENPVEKKDGYEPSDRYV